MPWRVCRRCWVCLEPSYNPRIDLAGPRGEGQRERIKASPRRLTAPATDGTCLLVVVAEDIRALQPGWLLVMVEVVGRRRLVGGGLADAGEEATEGGPREDVIG
jgi:hypothetical protein